MKAIVVREFGEPEVMKVEKVELPQATGNRRWESNSQMNPEANRWLPRVGFTGEGYKPETASKGLKSGALMICVNSLAAVLDRDSKKS